MVCPTFHKGSTYLCWHSYFKGLRSILTAPNQDKLRGVEFLWPSMISHGLSFTFPDTFNPCGKGQWSKLKVERVKWKIIDTGIYRCKIAQYIAIIGWYIAIYITLIRRRKESRSSPGQGQSMKGQGQRSRQSANTNQDKSMLSRSTSQCN